MLLKNMKKIYVAPVEYDTKYLKIIPEKIIEKDYDCGDPLLFLM